MILCYIDESGTSEVPGNTSHFVLAGLSLPIWHWRACEDEINAIKRRYSLQTAEIHAGWLIRKYLEQNKISGFDVLSHIDRRSEVEKLRRAELLRLQRSSNRKLFQQTKKNFERTNAYVHLTFAERMSFVEDVARAIGGWGFARLFAECVDKIYFDPRKASQSIDEQAFEQLVSRFERFLSNTRLPEVTRNYGLMIHDNNSTIARRYTQLMRRFHSVGTLWTRIENIIETPLFVNSELTSMVQIADVCAYALRRYLENQEEILFDHVFKRADKNFNLVVGVRHFTDSSCTCKICSAHRPAPADPTLAVPT
jgi:hypothetical protein